MRYMGVVLAFFVVVGVAFVIAAINQTGAPTATVGYANPEYDRVPIPGRTLYREPLPRNIRSQELVLPGLRVVPAGY